MKTPFKTVLLILFLPILVFANHDKFKGKYTKEKTISREYRVNANAKLKVDNSFGNLDIVTWDKNEVVIVVTIITNGNNEEKTQKRLDEIDVDFTANESLITAKTIFHKKGSRNWFGNNNISMEINYTIKIPVTNSIDISNDYGAINLTKLEGNAKIDCDYGQIIIDELLGDDNYLDFDYTSKSTIGYMKNGKINADYSGFTLDKAGNINLSADYTSSEILEVNNINYTCDYGKIKIDKVATLEGSGDYISHRIGTVSGSLNITADYGSIKIARLNTSVKSTVINADYTSIKLGYASDYNFNFSIDLEYASLSGKDNLTIRHQRSNNGSRKYAGFYGTENSENTITIYSEYGGISLIKK